jgi:hypothetical protein
MTDPRFQDVRVRQAFMDSSKNNFPVSGRAASRHGSGGVD